MSESIRGFVWRAVGETEWHWFPADGGCSVVSPGAEIRPAILLINPQPLGFVEKADLPDFVEGRAFVTHLWTRSSGASVPLYALEEADDAK